MGGEELVGGGMVGGGGLKRGWRGVSGGGMVGGGGLKRGWRGVSGGGMVGGEGLVGVEWWVEGDRNVGGTNLNFLLSALMPLCKMSLMNGRREWLLVMPMRCGRNSTREPAIKYCGPFEKRYFIWNL